jgi:CRP-like cAMP-binding protein
MVTSETGAAAAHLKSRLLDGLAPPEVKVVLAAARLQHFLGKRVVVNQGHPADHLFLLTNGRARFFFNTREGKNIALFWLTPGEIFGGAALLSTPYRYLLSAETLMDSSTLVWNRATLRTLATRYPRLLENALLIASDYLAWYLADHVALVSQTARQRLARVLVCLAETIGTKSSDGFEFDATNEELAGAANVTPFTTSRLLSEWQRNRSVVKRRGKILLRSPEGLFPHST